MARKAGAAAKSVYDVHPSIAYSQAVVANLKARTGRSLEEWVKLLEREGPKEEEARREFLLKKHRLGMMTAWMIAELSVGKGREGIDPKAYLAAAPGYVEAMYAGMKAALKPLHDALVELGRSLAPDVKVCPCETIVPFYREHVFAQIKPSTLTRIDFGLALKGAKQKPPRRLADTGGLKKGDRITHSFAITSLADIDAETRKWTKIAYDLDG
jgi:hypothetical protein